MECIKKYFIRDSKLVETSLFNENILKQKGIVYEVFRVVDGIPMFLEKHINRMENSLKLLGKEMPYNYEEIRAQIKGLIKENDVKVGNIKLLYDSLNKEENLLAYFIEHSYPTEEMYKNGVKTILYFGERENPNAKIINTSFRQGVNEEINKKNAYEAILVNREGYITEGSRSNIFIVKNDIVYTSTVKTVLPGVTRGTIIELCNNNNIIVEEIDFKYTDLSNIDGIFMSGTSPKVLPINQVGDIKVDFSNESIISRIMDLFSTNMEKYIENNKKFYY